MITKEQLCSICFEQIIPKWHSMPDTFPDFLQVFSKEEKSNNDRLGNELRKSMKALAQNPTPEQKEEIKRKMNKVLQTENILSVRKHVSEKLLEEFEEKIEYFMERAKAFDETLPLENIWQAMRNYLIYAMIVNFQGKRQNCQDTIFGYSLLYPYTDNYIDELHRKSMDKNSYNDLIRKTLSGENICPRNAYEEKTKKLLELVLNYYSDDIEKRKEAANLLLLMLEAQEQSILQIHHFGTKKLKEEEILRISAYKGGLSVFLDYLFSMDFEVASVTEEERYFYLCFGLILQLADDLQDIAEDKKKHSQTMITVCHRKRELEATVNRLLHFAQTCMTGFSPRNPELHKFMLQNCQIMLLAAVAKNARYFSKTYLEKLEPHLPMSFQQFQTNQMNGRVIA